MASVRLERGEGRLVVYLAGALDIYAAKETRAALGPALHSGVRALAFELSGVEELDLAGVQVLLWLKASAEAEGLAVELLESSPALDSAARALNLSEWRRHP